jgi:putative ABC transport system permease protein
VRNLADVQATREAASGVLTFWLSAVASVSLVVGGISIMNLMLVSTKKDATSLMPLSATRPQLGQRSS